MFAALIVAIAGLLQPPRLHAANGDARPSIPVAAPRIALVIGNTAYAHLTKLRNPGNDARLMSSRLKQLGFTVTEAMDRGLSDLSNDVDAFTAQIKQHGRDTVAVLFYAGHGLEEDSINYLVPVDAQIKKRADIRTQALAVRQIAEQLAAAKNALNILIVDACRDNPFPETMPSRPATTGLTPMAAVYGVFIASSTGSGRAALDGVDGHSPYSKLLADEIVTPGQKLEDVFKRVRRQVRLTTAEQQIPWESTALETDFYFIPPPPPPAPEAQLLAAAEESGEAALFRLLIERFPDSLQAVRARAALADQRKAASSAPAAPTPPTPSAAEIVMERARHAPTPEAFDLVAALFPGTPQAQNAQDAASKLREKTVLDSAGPAYEGRELVQQLQQQLARLDCTNVAPNGEFDPTTVQALRRATLLTDDRFLWHRPTLAAIRALRQVDARDGCPVHKLATVKTCIRIGNEDFCL